MCRIIFLGAGASVDAGYPVMKNLLSQMEGLFHNSRFMQDSNDWKEFQTFRAKSEGPLRTILLSNNPELIFSFLDLMEISLHEGDRCSFEALLKRSEVQTQEHNTSDWWESSDREVLSKMENLRTTLQRLLTNFFLIKNCKDESNSKTDYLENGFKKLKRGDTIITTNWDTLAERILLKLSKWYPTDGYGFKVKVDIEDDFGRIKRRPKIQDLCSTIKVLKLHGSVGWHRNSILEFYLRYDSYLQSLLIPEFNCTLRDKREPPPGSGPDEVSVSILPSLNKTLDDLVLQQVWQQSFSSIRKAQEIVFIGYSLPSADMAVRVLVNEIKERARKKKIKVSIVNPNKGDIESWQGFFDNVKFEHIQKSALEYFSDT